jgi:Peptidase family S41
MKLFIALALVCPLSVSSETVPAKADVPSTAAASIDGIMTIPHAAIAAGNAYWRNLGVKPPRQGFFLAHPWSPPWSGRSLVVPPEWFKVAFHKALQHAKDHTPFMVDAAALRADLPILRLVMERNYSGWRPAKRHGWNWNSWLEHWDAVLSTYGHKKIPDGEAFAPWFAYERFQIDSHSGPEVPSRFENIVTSESAMLASPAGTCTRLTTVDGRVYRLTPEDAAQQPHLVENWNGKTLERAHYIVYPSSFGEAKSLRCGKETATADQFWSPYKNSSKTPRPLDQSVAALSGGQEGLALYNTVAPGIGYLRLGSFSDAGDEAVAKLVQHLPPSAGYEKVLIVDLRDNDGGIAPIGLLSRWIPESDITRSPTQVGERSCLYPGLWFNLGQVLSLGVKRPVSDNFRRIMVAYGRDLMTKSPVGCPVTFDKTQGNWFYGEHHFISHWQGRYPRLLVLVDNECASDCEFMTWVFAQLPGTVIAGENTFGVIGFTQPGFLLLPHSRIVFQLATSRTEDYSDGRSESGYGLDVDVSLPTASDWSRNSLLTLANYLANQKG